MLVPPQLLAQFNEHASESYQAWTTARPATTTLHPVPLSSSTWSISRWVVRQHPFAHATLSDEDLSVNFAEHAQPDDRVAVVVTAPLTVNETWTQFQPGELKVFVDGQALA